MNLISLEIGPPLSGAGKFHELRGQCTFLPCSLGYRRVQIDRMARLARIIVPSLPHHVTQCGNGCAKVFFTPQDYALYKNLLVEYCCAADVGIWP